MIKRKSKIFGKKYDEIVSSIPLSALLGKALVYRDVKQNKSFAVIFTEVDLMKEHPYVDLSAFNRGLIQIYNYAMVNKLSSIAIAEDICIVKKSNVFKVDTELVIDNLFRFTNDIDVKIFMKS